MAQHSKFERSAPRWKPDLTTAALTILIAAITFALALQSLAVTAAVCVPIVAVLARALWLSDQRKRRN